MIAAPETHYADSLVQRTVAIDGNDCLAKDTYRLRITCPEIARQILPGQFVMIRLDGCDDPLIGRPLALYDTRLSGAGMPIGIDVVYLVKGKLTTRLKECQPGQKVTVWGPLGNGFSIEPTAQLIMVAGGIGQTPFLALAREALGQRQFGDSPRSQQAWATRVTLCYGARTAAYFAGIEDFQSLGVEVLLATDDGSRGRPGLVTDVLRDQLEKRPHQSARLVCCGPEPMMEAVARIAKQYSTPCQVSLETPMACGIGICFTCVAKVRDGADWDYRRTCVEGPVFDAQRIVW